MFLDRAIVNSWLNNDSDADDDFKASIGLNTTNQETYFTYIHFLTLRKRYDDACYYARLLESLNPNFISGKTTIQKMLKYTCNK